MKKVFAMVAVAAGLLFAGNANAQLGINLGYAPQTYSTTYNNGDPSDFELNGAFVGVNYNLPLSYNLGVSVGLQGRYNFKSETTSYLGLASVDVKHTQMLLDVPILVNYTFDVAPLKISPFLGPTIHYALSGKTKVDGNVVGITGSGESNWYDDNAKRNALDLSLTFGVAVQYDAFRLFGGYNMGMMNTSSADNVTIKGTNWFVGLGYVL